MTLANGNVLGTLATQGYVVEIDRETGDVVWDWKSPFGTDGPKCFIENYDANYRYHRLNKYAKDHPGILAIEAAGFTYGEPGVPYKEGCLDIWNIAEPAEVAPTVTITGGAWVSGENLDVHVNLSGGSAATYDVFAGFKIGDSKWYCYENNLANTTAGFMNVLESSIAPDGPPIQVFAFTVPDNVGSLSVEVFVEVMNKGYLVLIAEATATVDLENY